MGDISVFNIVMRFFHIFAVVIAVGGSIFTAFVVLPATHVLTPETRDNFYEIARKRSAKLVALSIGLLLITGFYNYLVVQMPMHQGQVVYHALMGVKILLAFLVFFIASAVTGKSPAFEKIRATRKRWIRMQILASVAIIAIGAVLRAIPPIGHH